jgi:hypothetical protein
MPSAFCGKWNMSSEKEEQRMDFPKRLGQRTKAETPGPTPITPGPKKNILTHHHLSRSRAGERAMQFTVIELALF